MHKIKLLVLALAAFALLALPGAASASKRDRDRDRMPDRWERKHDLEVGKRDARRDPDRDGLRNLAEFRAQSDPRDDDSDGDGIDDGDEHAGTIASFADGVLTIDLFGGGSVSGLVTDRTEIECEDDDDDRWVARASHDGDDDRWDDDGPRGDDDDHWDDDDRCPADVLAVGTRVHEAELELTHSGAVYEEIEIKR